MQFSKVGHLSGQRAQCGNRTRRGCAARLARLLAVLCWLLPVCGRAAHPPPLCLVPAQVIGGEICFKYTEVSCRLFRCRLCFQYIMHHEMEPSLGPATHCALAWMGRQQAHTHAVHGRFCRSAAQTNAVSSAVHPPYPVLPQYMNLHELFHARASMHRQVCAPALVWSGGPGTCCQLACVPRAGCCAVQCSAPSRQCTPPPPCVPPTWRHPHILHHTPPRQPPTRARCTLTKRQRPLNSWWSMRWRRRSRRCAWPTASETPRSSRCWTTAS